jgi:hypothetical protein
MTIDAIEWEFSQWPSPLESVSIGTSNTFTYTFTVAGKYYVYNDIYVTLTTIYGDVQTSICERYEVTVG